MRTPSIRILGPVYIETAEGPVTPHGRAARTVFAVLVIEANHMVPYDRLAHAIWGDDPPRTWLRTVQTHVSHLRSLRGPGRIQRYGDTYRLEVDPHRIDAIQLETLAQQAHLELDERQPAIARRLCRDALGLWRGPPFGDVGDTETLQLEVLRLEEIRMTVTELCFTADLQLGRHHEVIGALEAAARQFPYREKLQRCLIHALARCGRRTEAMKACRAYAAMLEEATGTYPADEIAILEDDIRREPTVGGSKSARGAARTSRAPSL